MENFAYVCASAFAALAFVAFGLKLVHMVINLCYETESWEVALTSLLLLPPSRSPSHGKNEGYSSSSSSSSSIDTRSRSVSGTSSADLDTILLKKIRRSSDENSEITT